MSTLLGSEVIEEVQDTAILGKKNVVANSNFQRDTNFWSTSGLVLAITSSGLQAVGSGVLYQNLNAVDVLNGTSYMAMCYVNTVSGTWKMLGATVASGLEASGAYSQTLSVGWNSVRFTAGATHQLELKSTTEAATDTLVVSPVEIREQRDLVVTGQVRNLDIEYGDVYFGSGTVTLPSISFEADKDTGIYLASTADMRLGASGIAQIAIKGSAAYVLSALQVGGSATFASNISIGQSATLASQLTVGGSATFASNISIGQSATLASQLTVGGSATFASNISIGQSATLASQLTVGGSATFASAVIISGNANVTGSIAAAGATFGGDVSIASQLVIGSIVGQTNQIALQQLADTNANGLYIENAGGTAAGILYMDNITGVWSRSLVLSGLASKLTIASDITFRGVPESSGAAGSNQIFRDGAGTSILYIKAT